MTVGPCDWPIDVTCYPGWDTTPPEVQAAAESFAAIVLWALTGRQFSVCPVTVRPCGRCVDQTYRTYGVWTDGVYNGAVGPTWIPYIDVDGAWRNCGCAGMCCCEPTSAVWLGQKPIAAITEVKVNNVVVPAGDYRLDIHRGGYWLVGQNGRIWPDCQNFDVPAASPDDTFVVVYNAGKPIPAGGDFIGGLLAAEYAKFCQGQPCQLSPSATSISRDGVTYEIASAQNVIKDGYTGHPVVDQWIFALNPYKLRQRPRVYSLDLDFPRQTV